MKSSLRPIATLLVIAAITPLPGLASDQVHFTGSYLWSHPEQMKEGELDVVFTPTGEGEWEVVFRFDWEDGEHAFEGTATGSLTGDLTGNVASDDPGHPLKFEFTGAFSDGAFSGTHGYFNNDGDLVDSGTLELTPAG